MNKCIILQRFQSFYASKIVILSLKKIIEKFVFSNFLKILNTFYDVISSKYISENKEEKYIGSGYITELLEYL